MNARAVTQILQGSRSVTRSRAPLRISFAGGGTDVSPYPERYGGCVLSCTIDKYAYVSLRRHDDNRIRVISEDIGLEVYFEAKGGHSLDGKIDLAQAILRHFQTTGLDCYMHSDAAPGSGLGSSSAMIVALIGGLAHRQGLHLTPDEIAETAYLIERTDLGIIGGMQDQYASSFGGFNFMEFTGSGVQVTPLRISEEILSELHYHLILCYTGRTRLSSNILAEQTANVQNADESVMESLAQMKTLTIALKHALLKGRLLEFGEILDASWQLKRKLASCISNAQIDELYANAKAAGAIGGKILGAGGGGYFLLVTPFTRRRRVHEALENSGGKVIDFQFEDRGVRSWSAAEETWL